MELAEALSQVGDDGCVIGRGEAVLLFAVLAIDLYLPDPQRNRLGGQQEVNAQSLILMEGARTIIPPGKGSAFRKEPTIQVYESPLKQKLKSSPLFVGVKDLAVEQRLIPRIKGRGTKVQVAAEDDSLCRTVALCKVAS